MLGHLEHQQNSQERGHPSSHRRLHFYSESGGFYQGAAIYLLSRIVANVLQLLLCNLFHWADDMRKGHGSGTTTSGHVIILQNSKHGSSVLTGSPRSRVSDT